MAELVVGGRVRVDVELDPQAIRGQPGPGFWIVILRLKLKVLAGDEVTTTLHSLSGDMLASGEKGNPELISRLNPLHLARSQHPSLPAAQFHDEVSADVSSAQLTRIDELRGAGDVRITLNLRAQVQVGNLSEVASGAVTALVAALRVDPRSR